MVDAIGVREVGESAIRRSRRSSIKELLTPGEFAELFKLASEREQQSLSNIVDQYSPEQAVWVIRHVLDDRRATPSQLRITPIHVPASEAISGTPPAVEKKGDALLVTYTVEELPFPNANGNAPDPAVRRYATELTPGGGASGGGTRLVDMREGE